MVFSRGRILIALLFLGLGTVRADEAWLRLGIQGGHDFVNQIGGEAAALFGAQLALCYPLSSPEKLLQTELGVVTTWSHGFSQKTVNLLEFGFSIRVGLKVVDFLIPYFIHDITSRILWIEGRQGYGVTYGVRLGLGVEIPLEEASVSANKTLGSRVPGFWTDLSYDFFDLSNFEADVKELKSLYLAMGLRIPL